MAAPLSPAWLLDQVRVAPERLAEALGAAITTVPAGAVEQFMASPLRHLMLETIFWQMPRQLDRARAGGVQTSVRWRITARHGAVADVYDLVVSDGRAWVIRGGGDEPPRATLTVDGVRFLRIITGSEDPTRALFRGDLQVTGDVMAVARVASLFRVPRTRSGARNT